MAYIVRIQEGGIRVYVGEDGYDEVEGLDLVKLHTCGESLPLVHEFIVHYEDDPVKKSFIEKFSRRNRLGREIAGTTPYLSSWHGPAPLPDMEYVGKPGDFLVEECWSQIHVRRIYLTLWVKGNRPKED